VEVVYLPVLVLIVEPSDEVALVRRSYVIVPVLDI
jgi:hypothetical protein